MYDDRRRSAAVAGCARISVPALLLSALTFSTAIAQQAESSTAPDVQPDRRVTLRISAPKAQAVTVGGEWSRGERLPLEMGEKGQWSITIGPLEPNLYSYL